MNRLLSLPFRLAPKSPLFYLITWVLWVTVLWFLSSRTPSAQSLPAIPHFDKVLHFGYFACGASLLTGFCKNSGIKRKGFSIFLIVFFTGAAIGALDEYHQSHVPGRFGNDLWDWLADCLGSICGSLFTLWGWARYRNTLT